MIDPKTLLVLFLALWFGNVTLAQAQEVKEEKKIEPEIVELDEMTVVGLSSLVSSECNLIHQLWERFMVRESEVKDVAIPKVGLEVSFDSKKMASKGEQEIYEFFVIVGLPVKSTVNIPEGMTYKHIPPHKYAKFVHRGPISKIMETYNYIFNGWLPQSGQEYDLQQCEVEWYDERFKIESEDSEFDIYIPIKDK